MSHARNGFFSHLRKAAVSAVAVGAVAFGAAGCAPSDPSEESTGDAAAAGRGVEEIKDAGTINIGVFGDKAPFGYTDSDGKPAGYDIEYAKRMAEDLGVEANIIPVEAASRVEFLHSGKVDVILANFTVTPEREEKVDFANPYMKVSLGVATPVDKPATPEDLKDRDIVIVRGTTADTFLTDEYPDANVTKYEQYTDVTNALVDGRGDAWVTDNTEALAWTENYQGKFETSIPTLGEPNTIAPAVQKGNDDLREWINEHQKELGEEDFFHKDFEKTLKPVYGDQISPDDLVVEGGQA